MCTTERNEHHDDSHQRKRINLFGLFNIWMLLFLFVFFTTRSVEERANMSWLDDSFGWVSTGTALLLLNVQILLIPVFWIGSHFVRWSCVSMDRLGKSLSRVFYVLCLVSSLLLIPMVLRPVFMYSLLVHLNLFMLVYTGQMLVNFLWVSPPVYFSHAHKTAVSDLV